MKRAENTTKRLTMSFTEKLGMFFFMLGLGIVIFSAALEDQSEFYALRLVTLIICGIFTALFNVHEREDRDLIISGGVFLLASIILGSTLSSISGLSKIVVLVNNMAFFIASILIVNTTIVVLRIASSNEGISFSQLARQHHEARKISIWDSIMLVAVVLVIVILILELFFDTTPYADILQALDWTVLALFLIDLIILWRKSYGPKDYLKNNWADIIAVIPFGSIFRLTKLARFVKIVRVLNRSSRISKVAKANRAAKFFSEKSGFNTYIKKDKKKKGKASKKTTRKPTKKSSSRRKK